MFQTSSYVDIELDEINHTDMIYEDSLIFYHDYAGMHLRDRFYQLLPWTSCHMAWVSSITEIETTRSDRRDYRWNTRMYASDSS